MSDGTAIEWTDATVNAVNGCSVLSPGCTNCYAMRLAGTRMKTHPSRAGLTIDTKAGPVWNGEVRFSEAALLQPLRWRRPRKIFWNAHGDLFHEKVPDDWIDRCFAVMALTPQHIHQVLTKRPERMREYVTGVHWRQRGRNSQGNYFGMTAAAFTLPSELQRAGWPLSNVWLGVSVEDQTRANERIPILLDTPAAVRWLSCEPLLGPVSLRQLRLYTGKPIINSLQGTATYGTYLARSPAECSFNTSTQCIPPELPKLDWVIAGGESGPNARPMHPDWARSLRDECATAGVPFLFKQWGEWLPCDWDNGSDGLGTVCWPDDGSERDFAELKGRRPMETCGTQMMWRLGKKLAGRLLDGELHDGFPQQEQTG